MECPVCAKHKAVSRPCVSILDDMADGIGGKRAELFFVFDLLSRSKPIWSTGVLPEGAKAGGKLKTGKTCCKF